MTFFTVPGTSSLHKLNVFPNFRYGGRYARGNVRVQVIINFSSVQFGKVQRNFFHGSTITMGYAASAHFPISIRNSEVLGQANLIAMTLLRGGIP